MKRQLATSLCTFALLTSLQPAAQADELADFLRSLVGPIMPGNNEGPAPANPGPGDALIAEVSGQHFSAQAPQLDPAVQPQWAIVVFGSALDKDGGVPQALSSRLEKALVVANTNPGATVVVAGGKPQAGVTEAQAMKRWLVEHGVGEERIVTEEQSTDTVGNAKNVAPIPLISAWQPAVHTTPFLSLPKTKTSPHQCPSGKKPRWNATSNSSRRDVDVRVAWAHGT